MKDDRAHAENAPSWARAGRLAIVFTAAVYDLMRMRRLQAPVT
jgi:hypothetical protein